MIRILLALALLLAGCTDPVASAQGASTSCDPLSTQLVEGRLRDAVDAENLATIGVLAERDDGRTLWLTRGSIASDPNAYRYISSSTAKPVATTVILDAVARGVLSLDTRVVDVLPGFAANAVGGETRITLGHLLAMRSGLYDGPLCWQQPDEASFRACVDALPLANPDREPGPFAYSTQHLDVAGAMLAQAEGWTDYGAAFEAWRARVGLFAGATFNPSFRRSAGVLINVTAAEYLAYANALLDCSAFPATAAGARVCATMQADANAQQPVRNGTTYPAQWPDGTQLAEDWHFALGLWLECESADYDCVDTGRRATFGAAGQYAAVDREHGYRLVITPATVPGESGYGVRPMLRGVLLARRLRSLLEQWAALGEEP